MTPILKARVEIAVARFGEQICEDLIWFGRNVEGVGDSPCETHRYPTTRRRAHWLKEFKRLEPSA